MLLNILLLIIGFVFLVRGADAFIDGASVLARRFNIPEIIIGLTVVAFGTSVPEFAVTLSSVLSGASGVAVGNVLGSNIVNILLVLGLSSLLVPLPIQRKTAMFEIPFVIFITLILLWFGARYGVINRSGAIVLCALFLGFMGYLYFNSKEKIKKSVKKTEMSVAKIILYLVLGLAVLILGSKMVVNSALNLANIFHVTNRIIGLTLVAFGTSLPELVTCISALRKNHTDLILGNIIGSNIFNVLFVLGGAALIYPIKFEYAFTIDAAISIVITIFLWLVALYEQKLTRGAGIIFLLCYAGYLVYLF